MYFLVQLVVKSYIPHTLEKGMWFVRKHYEGTDREFTEIFELNKLPQDKDEFLTLNGYPVKPYIVEEYMDGSKPAILATPEEIGWLDEGEDTDELRDITLEDINYIVNYEDGFLLMDIDGETGEPTLAEGKVILAIPGDDDDYEIEEEDPEDYDDYGVICDECGSSNVFPNSSGQFICDNCGWEEDNEE